MTSNGAETAAQSYALAAAGLSVQEHMAPLPSQPSSAEIAVTCALEIIDTASNSKLSKIFPRGSCASTRWRWTRRRPRSAISVAAAAH